VKVGDLVRCAPDVHGDENEVGIILRWVRTGGTEPTVWEVLLASGETVCSEEMVLEIVSESR
jgi:hypothetical protein